MGVKKNLSSYPAVEGPSIHITLDMVREATKKLKIGKAYGPSDITGELIEAAGEPGIKHLHLIINSIVSESTLTTDWLNSFLPSLFKGKGSATERGNYRGLKLIENAMKVL